MVAEKSPSVPEVATIQVVPGELAVREYWHEIPYAQPVPCWTYITQGLETYNQKELVITIRRTAMAEERKSPDFPLRLVEHIGRLAKQGHLVDAGGYTSMVLTDAKEKVGIPFNLLYLHPVLLPGVPLPSPALTVRLMSTEEYKFYITYGAMRLVSSWANHYRYFPYPPWSELPAPEMVTLLRFQSSILNKVSRLHVPGSTVNMEGKDIVLRLQPQARETLARQLAEIPPALPLAFLPHFDPQADACLAWIPETNQTAMNLTPASKLARVAGCFMLFIPEQKETSIRVFEDGFAMLLTTDTWVQLREAMLGGRAMAVSAADRQFRLEPAEASQVL